MGLGIRGMDDLVEKLQLGEIDDAAEIMVLMGKEPSQVVPMVGQISQNPQIWTYDFNGNMEGQNLDASGVAPQSAGAELSQRITDSAGATQQALAEYLQANGGGGVEQKLQYAGTPSVGSASLMGTPVAELFRQPSGQPVPGLGDRLRGMTNG